MRSLCVFNQSLAFSANELWISHLKKAANWSPHDLTQIWSTFASQESFRLSIYTLFFIDLQIASNCNTRPFLSPTESNWDLPPAKDIWESPSADEWLDLVQEAIQKGSLPSPILSVYEGQLADGLSVTQVTQSLLTGKPSPRLLKHLSACPFAAVCVIANLDSLVRDFSTCYYRMPSVLPDPSAYHVLSPTQNRSINAAVNSILDLFEKESSASTQMMRLICLSSWAARLSLCEPDGLLVSGIADTTLAAGLATSAHLVLGSGIATRRAVASTRRRFGEDSSMIAWDDLLKSLPVIIKSTADQTVHEAPWMTTLNYRILLLLWRTVRRAITELEQNTKSNLAPMSDVFSPAKIILHLVRENVGAFLPDSDRPRGDDARQTENALVTLMSNIFGTDTTPVGATIRDILSEIGTLVTMA